MLALRKRAVGAVEPSLEDVARPEPGAGQVRIAVTATGFCGTDIHILRDEYACRPPVTLGHEVSGMVDAVGAGVDPAWIGARVAPETAFSTCGTCEWCRTGHPMLCAHRLSIGSGVDGGFASHVVVPARLLHRVADWIPEPAAALMEPLACVCNALLDPAALQAGDRVVVIGVGAVGLLAAQVAAASGAVVTVVGTAADAHRLSIAEELGLRASSIDDTDQGERLRTESLGGRIDVVIECAGAEAAVRSALTLVRPRGTIVQIGLLDGLVSVPFGHIVTRELSVRGGFGSSPAGWQRAEKLTQERRIELEPLVTDVLPLREWRRAVAGFEQRKGIKTVFDPRLDA